MKRLKDMHEGEVNALLDMLAERVRRTAMLGGVADPRFVLLVFDGDGQDVHEVHNSEPAVVGRVLRRAADGLDAKDAYAEAAA